MVNWKKPLVYTFGLVLFALAPFMPVKSVERIGIYELGGTKKERGSIVFEVNKCYSGGFFRHGRINQLEIRLYKNGKDAVCEEIGASNGFDDVWRQAEEGKILVTRQRVVKSCISGLAETVLGRDIEEMNYENDLIVGVENIVGEAEATWTEYKINGEPRLRNICGVYLCFPELEVLDSSDGKLEGRILNNFQILFSDVNVELIENGNRAKADREDIKNGCKIRVVDFCRETESGTIIPERCRRIEILD